MLDRQDVTASPLDRYVLIPRSGHDEVDGAVRATSPEQVRFPFILEDSNVEPRCDQLLRQPRAPGDEEVEVGRRACRGPVLERGAPANAQAVPVRSRSRRTVSKHPSFSGPSEELELGRLLIVLLQGWETDLGTTFVREANHPTTRGRRGRTGLALQFGGRLGEAGHVFAVVLAYGHASIVGGSVAASTAWRA